MQDEFSNEADNGTAIKGDQKGITMTISWGM